MRALAVVLLLLALTGTAHANAPARASDAIAAHSDDPSAAVTTQPLAFVGRGLSVGYERLLSRRLSIEGLAGVRAAALGDYASRTTSIGAELRFWPRAPRHRALHGLYLALHGSIGRTALHDETTDMTVGATTELTQRIDAGWRFQPWRRLTIAPVLGIGVHQDFGSRLAIFTAPTAMLGVELGWLL
jgi:hypothetical protein